MQTKENKMGVMPIDKLLISMSLPMMISMLVQALYNIVDSIFVSRINEYALRAVSLAFPIQSLMIAVAVGTAVGINAFLSRTLGEKDFEKANIIARNGIFIAIMPANVVLPSPGGPKNTSLSEFTNRKSSDFYCNCQLYWICGGRCTDQQTVFCQPDGSTGGAGIRCDLSDYLLCGGNGYFSADDF